jgi:hypothetical protein
VSKKGHDANSIQIGVPEAPGQAAIARLVPALQPSSAAEMATLLEYSNTRPAYRPYVHATLRNGDEGIGDTSDLNPVTGG